MPEDITLQRFQRFKEMFISSDMSNNDLLDLLESYITVNDDKPAVEEIPILDGQLSLSEIAAA